MPDFRAYDAMAARVLCGRLPSIKMLILNEHHRDRGGSC